MLDVPHLNMADLDALQQRLGHVFRDAGLLRLALTHLEFLGDAVLGLVLTHRLYDTFATSDEGSLTKARAKLVNRAALAGHARVLDLGAHLVLGRGEAMHGGRERASALADAFEALLGALFLDGGYETARDFILREFDRELGELTVIPVIENPKGELQEFLQARADEAPEYHVVSASGPDHDREFECVVRHRGVELARGQGKSKKAALKLLRQEKPQP
jgi:ribonuclease-3